MMRSRAVRLACVLGLLAATVSVTFGGVAGSVHDFSAQTWSAGEICIVCHTPHAADTTLADAPLWNHQLTSATFTLYDSPTLDESPTQPRTMSRLCLSCHDGTVAVDGFGSRSGTVFASGTAKLGTDLSDDHPISIKWSHQTQPSPCSGCHGSHSPGEAGVLPFFDGYLECVTCHDVHDETGNAHLLRLSMEASELCQRCHAK